MRRFFAFVLCGVVFTFVLGCGDGSKSSKDVPVKPPERKDKKDSPKIEAPK
jgi:hypothetical protein